MKRFFLFTLTFILFLSVMAEAQIRRFGMRTGINMTRLRYAVSDETVEDDMLKRAIRPNLGFVFETGKNNYFITKIGFLYSSKGSKGVVRDTTYKLNMHYIEIPVQFAISFEIGDYVNLEGGFGPYFAAAFMGREEFGKKKNEEILGWNRKMDSLQNDEYNSKVKPFFPLDCGINFGGSVVTKISEKYALELSFTYDLGILKISNDRATGIQNVFTNPKFKNNTFTIALAFLFHNWGGAKKQEDTEDIIIEDSSDY